jgi:hypothetical protein
MDNSNNQQVDKSSKKKKKKQPKFLRNRAKYEQQYTEFNVTEKSPIRNGMVYDRQANDIIFGIAFIISFIGWVGIVGYGIHVSNLQKIFAGVDSDQNVCGVGKAVGKDYLLLQVPSFTIED